jgi:hypothetical protein
MKKNAFPCFPGIGPPPTILEFKLLPEGQGDGEGQDGDEVSAMDDEISTMVCWLWTVMFCKQFF